jgi:hypothetical protein
MKKASSVGKPSLSTVVGEGTSEKLKMPRVNQVYMISDDVKHGSISRDPGQTKPHMGIMHDKGDSHEDGCLNRK